MWRKGFSVVGILQWCDNPGPRTQVCFLPNLVGMRHFGSRSAPLMATYTLIIKNILLEVMEPTEPSATIGRNQLDGRANSCPPMGRDMTRNKGTDVAVVDECISTSHSHAGVAMLHAVGMSNNDPPTFRQAMKNPAATPVLMLRKQSKGNGDDFYWVAPIGSAGKEEGSGKTKANRRRAKMRKWKQEMVSSKEP